MIIERDRYLDDSRDWHLALALRSRSPAAHSLLTALTPEERDAVSAALVRALDEIGAIVKAKIATHAQESR